MGPVLMAGRTGGFVEMFARLVSWVRYEEEGAWA